MKTAFLLVFLLYSLFSGADQAPKAPNADTDPEAWIQVYKYNTEQESCDRTTLVPHDTPHAMQKVLNAQNIPVRSSLRGYDGLLYPLNQAHCVPLPTISIFEVPAESYDKIADLGFQLCQTLKEKGGGCHAESYSDQILPDKNQEIRRIYKYANQKQCQKDSGKDVLTMEQELIEAKIVIFQRYSGVDGLLHPFSCGSETGAINIYVIEKEALAQALSLGYRECAYLEELGGVCRPLPARSF